MRILFCNKYNFRFSGTEVYLFELMELLKSAGHDAALFSMADSRGEPQLIQEYLLPQVDFKNTRGLWQRTKLAAHAIYSREARHRLRALLAEFRPDVAHVRNIYHHLSPSILWELRRRGVPVLYHLNDFKIICPSYNLVSHGCACERCRGGRFWQIVAAGCYEGQVGSPLVLAAEAYFHKWLGTYHKCVNRFLAPSRFVREKLIENGWTADKVDVLYHFQKLPERVPAAPLPDAPVLYFGRLSSEKGLLDLLNAMQRLPGVHLQIAGEGPQRPELESVIEERRIRNVTLLGGVAQSELSQLIAASRFTVLPSHAYETLGKTILESYAQSRAVVATDLGSRREFVLHGETGLLCAPGNSEQLASAISYLHGQPQVSEKMGAAGRELLEKQHSPQKHYDALMSLYAELASESSHTFGSAAQARHKLRVAFIGGRGVVSKYSGIESYYEEIGRRLAERGHEVVVYCRPYFTPALRWHNKMRIVRLPTVRSKHLDTLVHTALSTLHAVFSGYDIVHYHALGPALFSFVPRLARKKTTVTVQGLDWQRKKWGRFASSALRLGERAAVWFPTSTMTVSRTLQEYYRARYSTETAYIPNGTRIRVRQPVYHLAQWGLEPDNYILFLGRFSPEKNCDLLIRAYEGIDTEVKLVLAGGSSYSDDYVTQLRRHQSARIRFLDWVSGDALEELLTNAMIFALPSDLEGLSLALLDAMGAGVCVLASDIPENCELVEGVGFTFRRRDQHDLERMLRWLVKESHLREQAGTAAQERIRQHYLWSLIADQVEQHYFGLMGWQTQPSSVKAVNSEEKLAA